MRKILMLSMASVSALALAACVQTEEGTEKSALSAKPAPCSIESIQAMAPADATITSAAPTAEPVAHCRVEGYVTTTDPGPNKVNFRLQLPDQNWAGRYYFIGMGATGGYVPSDSQIPAGNPVIKGFAVAGTDTGHSNRADWAFIGKNKAQALDHTHRGGHVVAQATQQITRQYYGQDKIYRYHSGCSGGGRMGMEAITRHPEDYDGFLIGAPGFGPTYRTETMLAFINLGQQMIREPGAWLPPEKLAFLEGKVTEKCDALDGAKDGIVWNNLACSYDFKQHLCADGDKPDCLTAPQLRSLEALLEGPKGPNGKIKDGFPITNMSTWSGFIGGAPPWPDFVSVQSLKREDVAKLPIGYAMGNSVGRGYYGEEFNGLADFDFNNQEQIDDWYAQAYKYEFGQPYSADITPFKKQGGKVIYWNGVSDSCCLHQDMEKYVDDVSGKVGGADAFSEFARFYKIPGMGHCGGGTGPQDAPDMMLQSLVEWVEKGEKPAQIVAHRGGRTNNLFVDPNTGTVSGVIVPPSVGDDRDFLLCPHPEVAKFNGAEGEEADAANWSCSKPA